MAKTSIFINKTPLSYRTNRKIGGHAPSEYLASLEKGDAKTPPIATAQLDSYLATHLINHALLRTDNFESFMVDRQAKLLALIEKAMDKEAYRGDAPDEGDSDERDDDGLEAEMTIAAE